MSLIRNICNSLTLRGVHILAIQNQLDIFLSTTRVFYLVFVGMRKLPLVEHVDGRSPAGKVGAAVVRLSVDPSKRKLCI